MCGPRAARAYSSYAEVSWALHLIFASWERSSHNRGLPILRFGITLFPMGMPTSVAARRRAF
jgi:hypothetical protein